MSITMENLVLFSEPRQNKTRTQETVNDKTLSWFTETYAHGVCAGSIGKIHRKRRFEESCSDWTKLQGHAEFPGIG